MNLVTAASNVSVADSLLPLAYSAIRRRCSPFAAAVSVRQLGTHASAPPGGSAEKKATTLESGLCHASADEFQRVHAKHGFIIDSCVLFSDFS
jgi:hypothetical protein